MTDKQASLGEMIMCGVIIEGERFLYISDRARAYLRHHGATPRGKSR